MKSLFDIFFLKSVGVVTFFGAFLLINISVQAESVKPRIIGGHDAAPLAYPWMAALLDASLDDSTEAHFCGASLIAPQYLVTAAHCATFVEPDDIQAMIGQSKLPFGRGDRTSIIGIFVHPDFNPITLENDVALLKLDHELTLPTLNVLQPGNDSLLAEGKPATIIGWGQTDPLRPILPVDLQEASIPVHSDQNCLHSLGRYFKPLSMMCAGTLSSAPGSGDGKDSCYGDSGGPIMVDSGSGTLSLAGTVSWGFACADNRTYGVYSDAMQLSLFLNSRPIAKPLIRGPILVAGDGAVGEKLSCAGGSFQGDPADDVAYHWYNDIGEIPSASESEYTPGDGDVGLFISCAVSASNQGGDSILYSDNLVEIAEGSVTGDPDPTPTALPKDVTPPVVSLTEKGCKSSRCTLTVSAVDESGVAGVDAIITREVHKRACSGKGCLNVSSGSYSGLADGTGLWSFKVKKPRSGSIKVKFSVRAIDQAGNITPAPLEVIVRARGVQ